MSYLMQLLFFVVPIPCFGYLFWESDRRGNQRDSLDAVHTGIIAGIPVVNVFFCLWRFSNNYFALDKGTQNEHTT